MCIYILHRKISERTYTKVLTVSSLGGGNGVIFFAYLHF